MMEEMDMTEEQCYWSRAHKPLPVQRILKESGQNTRKVSPVKVQPASPVQSMYDKENIHLLTIVTDKRFLGRSVSKDLGDSSECLGMEAMSSTFAVQQSVLCTPERLKPSLFSTSNLSSISLLVNASGSINASPQERFKTPKRRDEVLTAHLSNTPSSGSSRTQSSRGIRTPSSGSSNLSSSGIRYNPFDSHMTADQLHLPTLSPSVFATVSSPSNEGSMNGQFWSLEQQAELYPVPISDESPLKQSILYRNYREDSENKAQEQIELYFNTYHDVTSPPDLLPTGPLLVESPNASYTQPESGKSSKWTQTCITLPPVLPPQVESVLRQYNLISDISEEPTNLSNSTLRRKLFNADMLEDADESQRQSSSSEDEAEYSPEKNMTPGKILRTPVTSKPGTSAQWSSSPVRSRHRTSLSPPDLQSPMFSPITKGRGSSGNKNACLQNVLVMIEEYEVESEERENSGTEKDTSELYETAEIRDLTETSCIAMDMDSNSGAAWRHSPRSGEEDCSTAPWGLTLPSQGEDSNMNTESRIDTGYTTNTVSSLHPSNLQEDSAQPSTIDMDSGVSTSQQQDLTVSLILPLQPPAQQQHGLVLMSYAAENTNDISVGFPLGSSTPTKR